jgi:3-oxoacyl-[acyl-carrier-protein] synthase III
MPVATSESLRHVLHRLREVQVNLGVDPAGDDSAARLADEVDSMGLVELVAVLAEDCGVRPEAVEQAVGGRFGTAGELAEALASAGLTFRAVGQASSLPDSPARKLPAPRTTCWLSAATLRLPEAVESAEQLDARLGRPAGWLERHAGIRQRHVWASQDPLTTAAEAGLASLKNAGLLEEEVGALLVTSEAPPLLAGLAAALHHRLGLRPQTAALEVGGACTGFLAALWLARALVSQVGAVLIVAVEAPSVHLIVEPGDAGETAALFGDAAGAFLVSQRATEGSAIPLVDVGLIIDGAAGSLLRVEGSTRMGVRVGMEGVPLAARAVETMARAVREVVRETGHTLDGLAGVIVHGGNGRMADLVARQLGLAPERVWSRTAATGNLGSASLLAAWEAHRHDATGPVAWAAVGAGLIAGWALTGALG